MKPPSRALWRRRRFELANAFGLADRGWFIPYRYKADAPSPDSPYPEDAFEAASASMIAALREIDDRKAQLMRFAGRPTPPTPRFDQDWFTGLDAALLYALLASRRPNLIVEVGSGHSTRFAAAALDDVAADGQIVAIDPAPRAAIEKLAPGVALQQMTLRQAGLAPFRSLAAGDVLFIDSSHILMPGSDVDILLNRILPRLPAGVLVHIHDVFLPDPYPESWAWRGYNEQNAVAALVTGGGYDVIAASRYMETRMAAATTPVLAALPPAPPGAFASSLWLEKTSTPIKPI